MAIEVMFGSGVGFPAELKFIRAFIHALLSRVTLASAGLSRNKSFTFSFKEMQ